MPGVIEALTEEEKYLFAIFEDRSGLDLAEFTWVDDQNLDGCWRAWDFQWKWFRDDSQKQIDCSARSIGKALDAETPVPTPEGWSTMGELQVGSKVFDERGKPTTVIAVSPIEHDRLCYRVVFDDGASIVADEEHRWATWNYTEAAAFRRRGHPTEPTIRTTREISESVFHGESFNHRIDVSLPLECGEVDLPIPPYLFGYWLGDGNSGGSGITVGEQDADVVLPLLRGEGVEVRPLGGPLKFGMYWPVEWHELAPSVEIPRRNRKISDEQVRELRCRARDGEPLLSLANEFAVTAASVTQICAEQTRREAGGPVQGVTVPVGQTLARMGAINNKHIPKEYLRASGAQRLALLQGLMDSDGHVRRSTGRCEVTWKSERLARQAYELLLTLGQKPYFEKKTARCNGVDAGPVFRVGFQPLTIQPFRIPRKMEQIRPLTQPSRVSQRRIISVEEVASRPVRCIVVSSPSHLFLAGENFVPTHNSLSIKLRGCIFPFAFPGQEMVITAPELVHLEPITGLVENQFYSTKLGRSMLQGGRSSVTHRPFQMNFRNGSRIMGRIPQRDGRGIKGCVGAGTLVLTKSGLVPVEEVVVGEEVWTHQLRWRPVLETQEFEDDRVEIQGAGTYRLVASAEHQVLTRRNRDPQRKRSLEDPRWLTVPEIEDRHYWASPTDFGEVEVPPLNFALTSAEFEMTDDFWWLVGLYLADGYFTSQKKRDVLTSWRVHWVAHPQDQPEILARLERLGLKVTVRQRDHSSADILEVSSSPWALWLQEHCGRHADGKRFPSFALGLTAQQRRALFNGYVHGDGHFSVDRNRYSFSSASKNLMFGMQLLVQSLGFTACLSRVQPKVSHINGVALKNPPLPSWRLTATHGNGIHEDGMVWGKIKKITPIERGPVFNLVVEEDHSYLSDSIFSHNTHPIWLELDEGQDYPEPGWKETIETLKEQEEGARWRVHGVTRGVQDSFYRYTTAPDSPFLVHKYPAMWRPGWSDKERSDKIAMYGGTRDEPDYRRNVHGEHGDATSPLFVMHRLMACVDDEQESEYNQDEYSYFRVTDTMVPEGTEIMSLIDFPSIHKGRHKTFWCGMDVGFTTSPSEILVWAEERPKKRELDALKKRGKAAPEPDVTRLKLLMRIQLNRIGAPDQARVVAAVIKHYRPQAYSMDSTGAGLPIFQFLQDKEWRDAHGFDETVLTTIKGYNFSSKILVDFDETIIVADNLTPEELAKEAGIERNVVDYSTDMLRFMVDNKRWWMPWDTDLINEYQFATVAQTKKTVDQYGKKYSKGKDHALDASRMTVLGWKQYAIEELMGAKPPPRESVFDGFL